MKYYSEKDLYQALQKVYTQAYWWCGANLITGLVIGGGFVGLVWWGVS